MKIVILHCHFQRGGVTQVVENHVRWLRECSSIQQIILISGDRAEGLSDATRAATNWISIEDFDYDGQDGPDATINQRSAEIHQRLEHTLGSAGLSRDDTILHWHNHSLGKNTAAPAVIAKMAASGWRQLLQIHDFSEDNRPENYQRLIAATGATDKAQLDRYLYPVCSHLHYAALTRADATLLIDHGISRFQVHHLPNSVTLPDARTPSRPTSRQTTRQADTTADTQSLQRGVAPRHTAADEEALKKVRRALELPSTARWSLYPVRGIRRKNVGEWLLLSRWLPPDCFSGITLMPATPVEQRPYLRWKAIADQVSPRAVFDAGHHPEVLFLDSLLAADLILSTSVAEGFGMTFLEPWLAGREVIARRLPSVADDFVHAGLRLPKFYDQILIPGDAPWICQCYEESANARVAAWELLPAHFQPHLDRPSAEADCIDFALLTPNHQIEVLKRISNDKGFDRAVKDRNSELVRSLLESPDSELIADNANVIARQYSIEQTGKKLFDAYQSLLDSHVDRVVTSPRNAGSAIDRINQARPFYPCRTEVIEDA